MTRNRKFLLLAITLFQVIFFFSWFVLEKSKLVDPKSQTIIVRVLPLDPRDFISGNYFTLNYEFSNSFGFQNKMPNIYSYNGKEIFVVLERSGEIFIPKYFTSTKPRIKANQVAIRGVVEGYEFLFGIEKYFINELQIEPNPRIDKVEVELIIDENFQARIKNLIVNGKNFDKK